MFSGLRAETDQIKNDAPEEKPYDTPLQDTEENQQTTTSNEHMELSHANGHAHLFAGEKLDWKLRETKTLPYLQEAVKKSIEFLNRTNCNEDNINDTIDADTLEIS